MPLQTMKPEVAAQMSAVWVEGLTLRYGAQVAIQNLNLTVKRGDSFALLGPNGAGKSSLMSVLSTLRAPDQGRAFVAGFDVTGQSRHARQEIGMVFQDPSLDDRLSAEENLDFHGRVYGMAARARAAAIDEMLALVELEAWREATVRSFSGGMKRRLEIARALMHRPQVLFLDEPTTGLDAQTRNKIWDYLQLQRRTRGLTLFTTTHYIEEVESADQICIIDQGRIIAEGRPADLKRDLGRAYLHVVPNSDAVKDALLAEFPNAVQSVAGELAIPVSDEAVISGFLAGYGNQIKGLRYEAPTLEGVFLSLTGKALRDRADGAREGRKAAGQRAGRK